MKETGQVIRYGDGLYGEGQDMSERRAITPEELRREAETLNRLMAFVDPRREPIVAAMRTAADILETEGQHSGGMKWISEAEQLPRVAQKVLLAVPRQHGEFWDLKVAQLLIRHEGVSPAPRPIGQKWPTNWWWSSGGLNKDVNLVTGNSWWASLGDLPLPPGAAHVVERGYHCIAQPVPVWVPQQADSEPLASGG